MPPDPHQQKQMDTIVSHITWLVSDYPFVGTLVLLMFLDVITGLIAAFISKEVSSTASFKGMAKKAQMLFGLGLAATLEPYSGRIPLTELYAMFFIAFEGLSILENMARSGLPIPEQLRESLEKLRTKDHPKTPPSPVNIDRASNVTINTTQDQGNPPTGNSGVNIGVDK